MMQPAMIAPKIAAIMMGHMYRVQIYGRITDSAGIVGVGNVGNFGSVEEKDVEVVEIARTRTLET